MSFASPQKRSGFHVITESKVHIFSSKFLPSLIAVFWVNVDESVSAISNVCDHRVFQSKQRTSPAFSTCVMYERSYYYGQPFITTYFI